MSRIVNENFASIHFRRKDAVLILATVINRINTSQEKIVADPLMIFFTE